MTVYKCGTKVELNNGEYQGIITLISIRDTRVTYGISYFENGVNKENLFSSYEFTIISDSKKTNIGFKSIDK